MADDYDHAVARIEASIATLKWMVVTNFALTLLSLGTLLLLPGRP